MGGPPMRVSGGPPERRRTRYDRYSYRSASIGCRREARSAG
jgi:hypothetical protein